MKVRFDSLSFTRRPKLFFVHFLALLGFVLLSGFDARAETIKGTFRYQRQDGTMRPIKFAKIEIWRFAPRALGVWAWWHDGDATTDVDGKFTKNMEFVQSGVIYAVRVYATNNAAIVWKKDTVGQWFYREPGPEDNPLQQTVETATDEKVFDFDFTDEAARLHYSMADAVRHGFNYAVSHRDPGDPDQVGQANIQPHSLPSTHYNPVSDTIYIEPTFFLDDITLLHEYGHYLENHLSNFFPMPAVHDGCEAKVGGVIINSPEHAWMEGFADYFARVVVQGLPAGTVTGGAGTPSVSQLENPPLDCNASTGDAIEGFVAGSLWDLFDAVGNPQNEPFDFISQQDLNIFKIFDKELAHLGHAPTIWDFYNAWVARGLDRAALNRILSHNRIIPTLPSQTSEFLQMTAPSVMFPGQTYNVTVVMRNTGETTWMNNSHFLGSQNPQDNNNFQRPRVPLPVSQVPPGAQVTFNFTVTAPSNAGIVPLQFRMVHEFVEWFGDFTSTTNVEVRALRIEVLPISRTTTTETVRVNAYDQITGNPVQGTVTSSVTSPAPTGTNITFSRPWVWDCNDVANGRVVCSKEYLQVVFTVSAPGFGSTQYWY
jgi:Ig-like domain from next to BRCA1 gene